MRDDMNIRRSCSCCSASTCRYIGKGTTASIFLGIIIYGSIQASSALSGGEFKFNDLPSFYISGSVSLLSFICVLLKLKAKLSHQVVPYPLPRRYTVKSRKLYLADISDNIPPAIAELSIINHQRKAECDSNSSCDQSFSPHI
jgi:hypothetical protein